MVDEFVNSSNTRRSSVRWPMRLMLSAWGEDGHQIASMLWQLSRRYWKSASLAVGFNALAGLFAFGVAPLLVLAVQAAIGDSEVSFSQAVGSFGGIADSLFQNLGREAIFFTLIGLAVAAELLRNTMVFVSYVAAAFLQADVFKDVWGRIFDQLLGMSFTSSSRYQAGDLNQYVWDANTIYAAFQQINVLLGNILVMTGYIAAMLWISWPMTLVSLVAVLILVVLVLPVVNRVRSSAEAFLPARVEMGNRSLEFLSGLRLLHIFSRQDFAKKAMGASVDEAMKQTRSRTIWQQSIQPLMYSVTIVAAATFLVGGYKLTDLDALPKLLAFMLILYRLLPQVGNFNSGRAGLVGMLPVVRRVRDILRTDDKEFVVDGGKSFENLTGDIEFKAVSLRYIEGEQPAVRDVSFNLPKGGMVALVGESGGGKSTIADLILRLFEPDTGAILVNDIPLREYLLADWRGKIGVVSQDAFLFHSSIRDNIAFGRLDATDLEIERAAKSAHAHDFIQKLEKQYDTIIGDRGHRLSGGQRQRIAIARAIVRRPEILVLDEATSDLDSNSERIIQRALDELRSNRTIIAIAHRLSTVAMADEILVMEQGRIVERGTHTKLLNSKGRYAHMWQLQTAPEHSESAEISTLGDVASVTEG